MVKRPEPEAGIHIPVSAVPVTRSSGRPDDDAQDGGSLAGDAGEVAVRPDEMIEQRSGIAEAIRSLLRRDRIR